VQSQYIARIEGHIGAVTRIESVQAELNQDIAGALGQSDLRVNVALAELELCKARFERAVRESAPWTRRVALVNAFNKQRALAEGRLRELLIHREACGFRRNHILNELYPIAPKLQLPEAWPENDTTLSASR
jgi:hypothetical protein